MAELRFEEYQAKRIVNVHRHVDDWFWTRYSAHPYIGCRSGCEFCYSRGTRYLGRRSPDSFDSHIRVKTNAAELLKKELSRLAPDSIACGDWQEPAERRFRLSRAMLRVVYEAGFSLFVVERSPLLIRDLDLLCDINRKAHVCVAFSISNLDPKLKHAFEPRSPGIARRFQAMEALAKAGIQVGTSLMPVIPIVGDDKEHLEEVVHATSTHGGTFILASGLTMDGVQAERALRAACGLNPSLELSWRRLYNWKPGGSPSYAPPGSYNKRLALMVRELCARYGINDRISRHIPPGPLAVNKRIAERLFRKAYDLELAGASAYRTWAYRKAAWGVDEAKMGVDVLYRERGEDGLTSLPGVGRNIASEITRWLDQQPC